MMNAHINPQKRKQITLAANSVRGVPHVARMATLALMAALALATTACRYMPIPIPAGQAVRIPIRLREGATQMIEIDATGVQRGGSELVLSVGDIELTPLYISAGDEPLSLAELTDEPRKRWGGIFERSRSDFGAWMWSSLWPVPRGTKLKISNFGPEPVTLRRIRVRRGDRARIERRSRRHLPFPPMGWSDLDEIMARAPAYGIGDPRAVKDLRSVRRWIVERQRRLAFDAIDGMPLGIRMEQPIRGNVQVRSCRLDGGAAVVGISRPDPSRWRAVGPGWIPKPREERWDPLPRDKFLPRAFRVEGSVLAVAVFLAQRTEDTGSRKKFGRDIGTATVAARLFRLDRVEPVARAEWNGIGPEGRWVDLVLDKAEPHGEYVLELKAVGGDPVWLVWDRDRVRIPDTDLTFPIETIVVNEAPPGVRYDAPIPVEARVVGSAWQAIAYSGATTNPHSAEPHYMGVEMSFRTDLLPGETKIYHLKRYRP